MALFYSQNIIKDGVNGKSDGSGYYYTSSNSWKYAFDGVVNSGGWTHDKLSNQWISYQFNTPVAVSRYAIYGHGTATYNPKKWVFQGSVNGTSWIDLDQREGETVWASRERKVFTFDVENTAKYTYYRLYIFESNSTSYLGVTELEMMVVTGRELEITIPQKELSVPKNTDATFSFSITPTIRTEDVSVSTQMLNQGLVGTGTQFSQVLDKDKWTLIRGILVQ
ncbi:discoidin domain-containing protein [Brevibacillus porteri]|uniref:discoidin domain-containing protein n=1 Tax=Brevibacillus porteri TaxID=2126350 RepID=UPI00362A7B46